MIKIGDEPGGTRYQVPLDNDGTMTFLVKNNEDPDLVFTRQILIFYPNWISWIAQDGNGLWNGFQKEPIYEFKRKYWIALPRSWKIALRFTNGTAETSKRLYKV